MDKYIHLSFLLLFPVDLVIGRYPEILSIDPRIFCAYCIAVPCHLNTPTDNFSPLSSIRSSPVDSSISQKYSKDHSIFRKSSGAFCSWNSCLLSLWLILSLVILLASLVIIILSPLIQSVVNARNPQSDPRIHPSGSDVIWNVSWFSPNQIVVDCAPMSIELIHPWSESLFLILRFVNHNSFAIEL